MKEVGYYNGKIGPLDEVTCPILDRAVYFGDGCYDATMFRNGKIFAADMHINRFFNSARLLKIDLGLTKDELLVELMKVADAYDGDEGLLYWQASRGTAFRSHAFPENAKANLMIFMTPHTFAPKTKELNCITVEDKRFLYCNVKTLNLLPNCLVTQECVERGADEVVFVRDGYVTEMAHSNVSFLVDGTFTYHPMDDKILPGIAMQKIIAACKTLGIPTEARALSLVEAMNADEVISSMSSCFCARVNSIDGIPVGRRDDKTFRRIQDAVHEEFLNETK